MPPLPSTAAERWPPLDLLRALAMVWMAAFHFAFDLNHFGLLAPRQNFHVEPFWTVQRSCIVGLFLFCAGLGQGLAPRAAGWPDRRFWRRWAQISGCALLVSIGSALMFPRSWIFFGVLHGMAVMLLLVRLLMPWLASGRWWLWPIALLCLVLPHFAALPLFDAPALQWLGLMTKKPVTEDYVPLLPWLGVMLLGVAAAPALRRLAPLRLPPALTSLAALGRWPLSFYMLHQPVLIGAILLVHRLKA